VESVLLLGGDSDIGVAIARRLVRRGAREVLLVVRALRAV
jgi:NAD(P)-dependent dehydrogenase (short-subunit alcohol dehydrogenase family)